MQAHIQYTTAKKTRPTLTTTP